MDFRSHHRRETVDTIYINTEANQIPLPQFRTFPIAPTILGAVCYVSTHIGISLRP